MNNNLSDWAYKTKNDIKITTDSKIFPLKAGSLFIYDPNRDKYVYIFTEKDIPNYDNYSDQEKRSFTGMEATLFLNGAYADRYEQEVWLKIKCPEELKIPYVSETANQDLTYWRNNIPFRTDVIREDSGGVGKKYFKFGEKAIFVDNFPLSRGNDDKKLTLEEYVIKETEAHKKWGNTKWKDSPVDKFYRTYTRPPKYRREEVYATLGCTELKVLIVDKQGKLDLIPFFAVDNLHKRDWIFIVKWWIKLWRFKVNNRYEEQQLELYSNHKDKKVKFKKPSDISLS